MRGDGGRWRALAACEAAARALWGLPRFFFFSAAMPQADAIKNVSFVLVFAQEVSVGMICVAAVILVFAEEMSVRGICVVAVILVFAEEMSVRGICVVAVIWFFAEEVSV